MMTHTLEKNISNFSTINRNLSSVMDGWMYEYKEIIVRHVVLFQVASGLPVRNGIFNAREIGRLALTLLFKTVTFHVRHKTQERLQLRMAINTGTQGRTGILCKAQHLHHGVSVFCENLHTQKLRIFHSNFWNPSTDIFSPQEQSLQG